MKCCRCHTPKPSDEFYNDRTRPNGKDYTCKSCRRERNRERDKTPERIEKAKKWLKSERGKEVYRKRYSDCSEEEKVKRSAHRAIRRLIKLGGIKRQPCNKCGDEQGTAHHPHYSQPLVVVWLCQKHHSELHRL